MFSFPIGNDRLFRIRLRAFVLQLMKMQIFFSGGHSSPDVPFFFVLIQYFLYFRIQVMIDFIKAFGYVFMDCTFANSEIFCRTPDSGFPL